MAFSPYLYFCSENFRVLCRFTLFTYINYILLYLYLNMCNYINYIFLSNVIFFPTSNVFVYNFLLKSPGCFEFGMSRIENIVYDLSHFPDFL